MRLVSLSPSITEILFALKAAEELRGVTDLCEIGEASIERIGGPKALEFSKIDGLKPDIILADFYDNRPDEVARLGKKWKVKTFEVKGPEAVCDAIAELGRVVGKKEKADEINQKIREEMKLSREKFPRENRRKTVLLLWNGPYLTVNFDTYPSRLIEVSGGLNVFREEPLYEFPVELEDMIEKEPEILLLSGKPGPFQKRHIADFRRYRIFSKIPIHVVEGKLLSRYGMSTVEALKHLREIYETLVPAAPL